MENLSPGERGCPKKILHYDEIRRESRGLEFDKYIIIMPISYSLSNPIMKYSSCLQMLALLVGMLAAHTLKFPSNLFGSSRLTPHSPDNSVHDDFELCLSRWPITAT